MESNIAAPAQEPQTFWTMEFVGSKNAAVREVNQRWAKDVQNTATKNVCSVTTADSRTATFAKQTPACVRMELLLPAPIVSRMECRSVCLAAMVIRFSRVATVH